jgi:hypothetical protein
VPSNGFTFTYTSSVHPTLFFRFNQSNSMPWRRHVQWSWHLQRGGVYL